MSVEGLTVVLVTSTIFAIFGRSIIATGIAIGTAVVMIIASYTGLPLC